MKNDMQIRQDVLAELAHDPDVPSDVIGVEVHCGVVKLAGCITDTTIKRSAELDARRVAGVTSVILDMGIEKR